MDGLKKVAEFIQKKNLIDKLNSELNVLKEEMKGILEQHENDKIYLDTDDERITVSVVKTAKIDYDVEKIKEKLGADYIKREYEIKDPEALKKVFKKAGTTKKEFLNIINVIEVIDQEAIDEDFKKGRLTLKKMKGMYKATISKQIRMTKKPLE